MEENQKRTPGGRNENRRSNNNRPRREGGAQPQNRGSNAQPRFDPHFVSAPEATPLRPAKKTPAAQPAEKQAAPAQNPQNGQHRQNNNARTPRKERGFPRAGPRQQCRPGPGRGPGSGTHQPPPAAAEVHQL